MHRSIQKYGRISALISFILVLCLSSCEDELPFGPIGFGTDEAEALFFLNGEEMERYQSGFGIWLHGELPRSFTFHSFSGPEKISVDYFVRSNFGYGEFIVYTSNQDYIDPNSNDMSFIGDPIVLSADQGDAHDWAKYTVDLNVDSSGPSWEVARIPSSSGSGGSSNPLVGRWDRVDGCANINNEVQYFIFNGSGSGLWFISDCNSACESPYGLEYSFNWSSTSDTVSFEFTSAEEYCGVIPDFPPEDSEPYSINGNILTLGDIEYERS